MVGCVGIMLIMMLQMFGVTGPADSPMNKLIAGGMAMFFGFLIVVMNLAADLLTGMLDPRVRITGDSSK